MKAKNAVFSKISESLGISIKEIQRMSPDEMRRHIEARQGTRLVYTSQFPTVGRGNVLRDKIVSHEEINRDVDRILCAAH